MPIHFAKTTFISRFRRHNRPSTTPKVSYVKGDWVVEWKELNVKVVENKPGFVSPPGSPITI